MLTKKVQIFSVLKDGTVVCDHCGAVIMTAQENYDQRPPTAGNYTASDAADSWYPVCPGCGADGENAE